jgi:DHA1 family bicyclomycin/chloramphenicol resistance-like MFS transporter
MQTTSPPGQLRRGELLALLSMTIALGALSIDLMLPGFGEIRAAFGMPPDSSATAGIVTAYMVGLSIAQIFYGPFSDRFGRKPVLAVGFALYALGATASALAPTFGWLLAGRVLWGMGAAGPRVLSISIIRDTHEGDRMARTMSFIMAVFILVPVFAPSVGAAILAFAPWRALFWFCVGYVALIALWAVRLPETLPPDRRIELRFDGIRRAARTVLRNRATMGHALALMLMFAALLTYLGTSELIVDDVFGLADRFPLIFGGLAALMGSAVLGNASIVERFGARRIARWSLIGFAAGGTALAALALATGGRPGFWPFVVLLAPTLCCYSLTGPNLNTLAMDPMRSVAGTAAAVIGTMQTGGGALIAAIVDGAYDGTVVPFTVGVLGAGLGALAAFAWADRAAGAGR